MHSNINNSTDNTNDDLLQKKIDEFKEKQKTADLKQLNYTPWATLSLLVAASALGFVGGTLAVKMASKEEVSAAILQNGTISDADSGNNLRSGNVSLDNVLPVSSVTAIAERNIKSIAEINTETAKKDKSLKQYTSSGAGSGLIVSSDGYIMTNNHVVSGANKISVTIDGEKLDARLVGADNEMDIALIKVDKTDLPQVTFGDSSNIKVGESVVAIGNPLGQLGGTVTEGVISALNRDITINNETMTLLQTDAAINPGNSGGGLFNLQGELIGMVTAKSKSASSEGIGFAIPVNDLKKPLNDLKEFGYVRGRINLEMGITDAAMFKSSSLYKDYSKGVFITDVPEDSNAKAAGFQTGDCIISINEDEVSNIPALNRILKKYTAGDTVIVGIMRKEESFTLNLQFAEKK